MMQAIGLTDSQKLKLYGLLHFLGGLLAWEVELNIFFQKKKIKKK